MKPFVRRYDVPLYGTALYVVVADSVALGAAALPKQFDKSKQTNLDVGAITCWNKDENMVACVFTYESPNLSISHIAHEAFHATDDVLETVGIAMRKHDANEAYAYLIAWIAQRIYDAGAQCSALREKQEQQKET